MKRVGNAPYLTQVQPDEIVVSRHELFDFLVHQVRYALGRMTYVVGQAAGNVRRYAPILTDDYLALLIRDIRGHGTDVQRITQQPLEKCYGMDMDYREWIGLLSDLEAEQSKRVREREAAASAEEVKTCR